MIKVASNNSIFLPNTAVSSASGSWTSQFYSPVKGFVSHSSDRLLESLRHIAIASMALPLVSNPTISLAKGSIVVTSISRSGDSKRRISAKEARANAVLVLRRAEEAMARFADSEAQIGVLWEERS